MSSFLKAVSNAIHSFGRNEQGAQVVEYALIIAVVSIILVVALRDLTGPVSAAGLRASLPA